MAQFAGIHPGWRERIVVLPRHPAILMVPALLLFFFLALDSLVGDSPTMDEQNHLARGLAFLGTGDPRLSLEHPPLINVLSAMAVRTLPNIRLPTDHPSWEQAEGWYTFADQLLWYYNHDVERMVFLARIPIVFLTIGLALIGYRFAGQLWGWLAGFFAFIGLLFDPNILAHGRYATTDVGGAAFLLLAVFLIWRMWTVDAWNWPRTFVAGIGLGLAFGSKTSNLVFVPIFGLMALLPLYGTSWAWRTSMRRLLQYGFAGLISLAILWMIFGFEIGPVDPHFLPVAALQDFNVPMPTFWSGIGQIVRLSGGGRPGFLFGEYSSEGWWYYFPVAFLVKSPIPLLLLVGLAAILLVGGSSTRARTIFLLLPATLYFLVSITSALNIGYRHLMPIVPLLYVMVSGLAALFPGNQRVATVRRTALRAVLFGSLAIILLTDVLIHPHYLSFFNMLAGGPSNGHRILSDSNVDWGQDLLRLKEWMAENNVERIKLSYFGSANPDYYGINYDPLPGLPHHFDLWWDLPFDPSAPEPGIYAISVSNLWELFFEEKETFRWFRSREPDDRVGYSIHIYYVDDND